VLQAAQPPLALSLSKDERRARGSTSSPRAVTVCLFVAMLALAAAPVHANPDRIVAERVLRLGGAVILEGQRRRIADLRDLPDGDLRLHTLDLVGVSMGAWGLKDELSRLPPLSHLKELYVNGRLWYNQPPALIVDTLGLFTYATELQKLVLSNRRCSPRKRAGRRAATGAAPSWTAHGSLSRRCSVAEVPVPC
jgi:hypothetical protein